MRYAYAITGALLLGGAAATMTLQPSAGAQTPQNEPSAMAALAPRAGAPLSFADLVAKLQPAVVNISTKQSIKVQQQPANPFAGTPFAELFGGQNQGGGAPITREAQSLGSGFLISDDGYVVTNNHVVAPGARGATVDSITVTLTNRQEYVAKLVGRDPTSDLALLKIDAKGLPFVRFGDSTRTRVGDWVIAIGNPFGIGSTVTAGIVSALHRVTGAGAYDRFIQTDAAINQGNSGGPMFDLNGNVIGINSQIFAGQSGGNIGIGFAIPAEDAKPVIDKLMKGTAIARGYLGVGLQPMTDDIAEGLGIPKNTGEIIRSVNPGDPADKAGIKVGDVVVAVNGTPVTDENSLSYLVARVTPGARAALDVIRAGRKMTLNVTVGTRPPEEQLASANGADDEDGDNSMAQPDTEGPGSPAANKLGLGVQPLTPQIAQNIGVDSSVRGVVINGTDPTSDAGQKLKRGDVIILANGMPVTTQDELSAIVSEAVREGRTQVVLYVQRQKLPATFVPIKLKK